MALAMAMGLRPEAGLYTSIIGGAISGMISNAPLATPGLSATVVPVLAVLVRTRGVGAAVAAGALNGLIMTLIGALRVGRFFSYLPHPVIAAFTSGLGVIIVSTQIKAVFCVEPAPVWFDLGVARLARAVASVRAGALIALPLFVKRASILTRLEPIVPDPANKEPSAIDPSSFVATPGSAGVLACHALTKRRLSEVDRRERLRSQWRRSTSNSLQAPEENKHDKSTTLRPA
jgi:Sulfate permease family